MESDGGMRPAAATYHSEGEPDLKSDEADGSDAQPLRDLQQLVGGSCADCGTLYSARDAVFSIALGLKDAPRCLPCTSRRLERNEAELRLDLLNYVHRRPCYRKAWHEAERIDDVASDEPCASPLPIRVQDTSAAVSVAAEWDAGSMGCGELVMALRLRMQALPSGAVIRVRANDSAAPEDLPAWCRLCGHTLVAMNHPHYWIRRKGD